MSDDDTHRMCEKVMDILDKIITRQSLRNIELCEENNRLKQRVGGDLKDCNGVCNTVTGCVCHEIHELRQYNRELNRRAAAAESDAANYQRLYREMVNISFRSGHLSEVDALFVREILKRYPYVEES